MIAADTPPSANGARNNPPVSISPTPNAQAAITHRTHPDIGSELIAPKRWLRTIPGRGRRSDGDARAPGPGERRSAHQCPSELGGLERTQILELLPHSDQLHRNAKLVRDRQGDPALGCPVELRQDEAGDVDRL